MILWRKNIKLDSVVYDQLKNEIKSEIFYYGDMYTTYFKHNLFDQTKIIQQCYDNLISDLMFGLSLKERTNYHWYWWAQLYNSNTSGHDMHDHFNGYEHLSWVHFVDIPKQKCFYFINNEREKHYPLEQNAGDFIAFPAWAKHGVDKVVDDGFDRLIVAGNVEINHFKLFGEEKGYDLELEEYNDESIIWKKVKRKIKFIN